jgi:ankyrin repeat protein
MERGLVEGCIFHGGAVMSKKLKAAIEADDAGAVRAVAKGVKDLNRKLMGVQGGAGRPVVYACKLGKAAALEALLEAGALPRGEEPYVGFSLFVMAAEAGREGVMEVLLRRGVATAEQVEHALQGAARVGNVEVLRWILEHAKPRVTPKTVRMGLLPRKPEIVELLLAHGGDVRGTEDLGGERGLQAIHAAARGLELENVEALVRLGADINARDGNGRTPLVHAAAAISGASFLERGGKQVRPKETIALMLTLGADARARDEDGNGALMYYQWESRRDSEPTDEGIVTLLKEAGAEGGERVLAMFEAIRGNNVEGLREAIRAGAEVNAVLPGGGTPLMSVSDERLGCLEVLLKAGADVNKRARGTVPLIVAARGGDLETVKRLIAAGAEAGAQEEALSPEEAAHPTNAYVAAELNRQFAVVDYLRELGVGRPVVKAWKPLEAGVGSWNDFSEVLVKAPALRFGEALAKRIGGTARGGVYGQLLMPGKTAYVVAQPKGMAWSNVFRVWPPVRRFEEADEGFLRGLAEGCGSAVLAIGYRDTSDAASVERFEPGGEVRRDLAWDHDVLEEMVGAMGKKAPGWAKKRLRESDKEGPSSTEQLERLAKEERFVVAEFGINGEEGRAVEVAFGGLPGEAFEEVVWVSGDQDQD